MIMSMVNWLTVFGICFFASLLVSFIYSFGKTRVKRKHRFRTGTYDGKSSEVDKEIVSHIKDDRVSRYLEDDMEHHSSKAFKSIVDPDER